MITDDYVVMVADNVCISKMSDALLANTYVILRRSTYTKPVFIHSLLKVLIKWPMIVSAIMPLSSL